MSYSESMGVLFLISDDSGELQTFVDELREELEKMGSQYEGPIPLPQVTQQDLTRFIRHIENPDSEETADAENLPNWLFSAVKSEDDLDFLAQAAESGTRIFGRQINIYGDEVIATILSNDVPENITVTAELGKKTHGKGGGNSPYTYDPNVDHVTDI